MDRARQVLPRALAAHIWSPQTLYTLRSPQFTGAGNVRQDSTQQIDGQLMDGQPVNPVVDDSHPTADGLATPQSYGNPVDDQPVDDPPVDPLALDAEIRPKIIEARDMIERVIFGQRDVIDQVLISLLCGGHALLVGLPGLGKTKLVETVAVVFGLDSQRIQCTPDLMPGDIIGSEILDVASTGQRSFRFVEGPVFCQLLMADEINRASPRTQSALLQAMQERRVTVAGRDLALPDPFHVLATQNPLEHEGTYPLPEAQLDRFLLQVNITHIDRDAERRMLLATTGSKTPQASQCLQAEHLLAAQSLVRHMPVSSTVTDAILTLVRAGRPETLHAKDWVRERIGWGPGPRAGQTMILAVRARALLDGRLAPSIDDVIALAPPVLRHRMALSFVSRAEGVDIEQVIQDLCDEIR